MCWQTTCALDTPRFSGEALMAMAAAASALAVLGGGQPVMLAGATAANPRRPLHPAAASPPSPSLLQSIGFSTARNPSGLNATGGMTFLTQVGYPLEYSDVGQVGVYRRGR